MRTVSPVVYLVALPGELQARSYLDAVGAGEWETDAPTEAERLVEFGGRLCYRAWKPGLNVNVTKIRESSYDYLGNILRSGHGSVLEHASASFVFHNVSRVFTHELVRHRAGTAISQESMRYVRLTDIPFWFPNWAKDDPDLMERSTTLLLQMEAHQHWMAQHFKLDDPGANFELKKHKTSFMRRFAPDGVATGILWTANMRALRHVLKLRTEKAAEEEIRLVFDMVGQTCKVVFPHLFQDFERTSDGEWKPKHVKV